MCVRMYIFNSVSLFNPYQHVTQIKTVIVWTSFNYKTCSSSIPHKESCSYGADLRQVEALMLHWGYRTIVKAASRVMAWLGNLSAQQWMHCKRNQSINNYYGMFVHHVSMTKRSHLIIRVLQSKAKMNNDKYFRLFCLFLLNAWVENTVYWQAFYSLAFRHKTLSTWRICALYLTIFT